MASVDYAALKKGGFMRQKQKGYFSLRLAVVGGNLTAENIKTVAEVAEKYGKGYVHMTSRQGIEIPFISFEDIEKTIGFSLPDSAREHRAFWANTTTHSIALSWLSVGYKTVDVDIEKEIVVFEK